MQRAGRPSLWRPSAARGRLAPQMTVRCREFLGGQVAETRMRPRAIVRPAPVFDLAPRIVEREEHKFAEVVSSRPKARAYVVRLIDGKARKKQSRAAISASPCQIEDEEQGWVGAPRLAQLSKSILWRRFCISSAPARQPKE